MKAVFSRSDFRTGDEFFVYNRDAFDWNRGLHDLRCKVLAKG
jgi:hypothetical protein